MDQSYLVYDCKFGSFDFNINKISKWKSTCIFNYFSDSKYFTSSGMIAVGNASGNLPDLKNDGRMHVYLSGNQFQQNKIITPNNNNAINIYCVYQREPISSSRDNTFTVQNALFGAIQITKKSDTSTYDYKGYGICFDEGGTFDIRKNIFACLFSVHNTIILSRHEQVSLMRLQTLETF